MMKIATIAGNLIGLLKGLALINPYVALGAGAAVLGVQLIKSINRQKELNRIVEEGEGTNEEMKKTIEDLEERYNTARNRLKGYAGETKATGKAAKALKKEVKELKAQLDKVKGTYEIRLRIKRETDALMRGDLLTEQMKKQGYEQKNGRLVYTVSGILYDADTGEKFDPKKHKGLSTFDETKPDDADTDTDTKGPKSRLPELNAQYASMLRGEKGVLEIMSMRQEQAMLLARATADNNQELISTANLNNISLDFAEKELEIEKKLLDDLDKASKLGTEAEKIRATEIAQRERNYELAKLLLGTEGAIALEKQRAAIAEEERNKAMSDQLFTLREQLGLVTDDERIARFRQEQEKQFGKDDPRVGELTDLYRQTIDPTFAEAMQQNVRQLRDDLEGLINPINMVVGAATTIGDAFATSFADAISGSKSAKQALADFFKSVGNFFLDLAKQIITKMITIAILNQLANILPSTGGGGNYSTTMPDIVPSALVAGDGVAIGKNGIVPYAKGGLVTKPTLFKYAEGGSGRFGLMAEAGPEAIMPLKRGPGGKLGVEAHGAGSSDIDIFVNVDASSSNVQSNGQQGKALGQAIGAAVQAELIKQKRPGGLLS